MSYSIQPYDDALQLILEKGKEKSNKRTGVKTKYIAGITSRYDLTQSFPLVTRRKIWPKSIWAELVWFLIGSTDNRTLKALGSNIWSPWEDEEFEKKHGYVSGCLGPVYGFQLRHFGGYYGNGIGGHTGSSDNMILESSYDQAGNPLWDDSREPMNYVVQNRSAYGVGGFDQLAWMIKRLNEDSSCRRIMFSLWNPKDFNRMRLPPCHYTYQVVVDDNGEMTGILTQRSADFPIGVPANIQFYSTLTMMLAQQTGFKAVEFVHNTVDSHIYYDQIPAVEEYLSLPRFDCPDLSINKASDIFSYCVADFVLSNYQCGPKIKIPVAV